MPLPDDYLTYPERKYGMDNPYFEWSPSSQRAPLKLKSGAKVACFIIVPIEFFPLNPPDKPFKHPGAMKTPYPDLRHYTVRDYGNRIGVYRLLREFEAHGLKASFAINTEIADRYAPLVKAISSAGHEIAAHGVSTAHIHHDGLDEAEERKLIHRVRSVFPEASTWLSPARNQSYRTLDLLSELGFTACLDWEADQIPLTFNTRNGPIVGLPLMNEIGDMKLLMDRSQSEQDWADQIIEAAKYSIERSTVEGAQCFGFTLTPYVAGQPFRIHTVRRILSTLASMDELDIIRADEVPNAFEAVTAP